MAFSVGTVPTECDRSVLEPSRLPFPDRRRDRSGRILMALITMRIGAYPPGDEFLLELLDEAFAFQVFRRTVKMERRQVVQIPAKAMFSQAVAGVLMASILMGTSILTAFAQNDVSEFIKNRNSYPFWNGSLKRDIQGFKPGMTESEAKQALSGCEVSGHKVLCPGASKDESFELSLTEHTRPRVVKDVTYVFPAGGATLGTMAKNVMTQFGVGNSEQCLPTPQGTSECSQWQLEDGSYMRLGVDVYRRNMFLYLSTPKWIDGLEEHAVEREQGRIPPRKF